MKQSGQQDRDNDGGDESERNPLRAVRQAAALEHGFGGIGRVVEHGACGARRIFRDRGPHPGRETETDRRAEGDAVAGEALPAHRVFVDHVRIIRAHDPAGAAVFPQFDARFEDAPGRGLPSGACLHGEVRAQDADQEIGDDDDDGYRDDIGRVGREIGRERSGHRRGQRVAAFFSPAGGAFGSLPWPWNSLTVTIRHSSFDASTLKEIRTSSLA